MKEVICQFCQQPAPYSPLEEMEMHAIKVYWCEPCHAEYLQFSESPHVNSCSLYTTVSGRMYRWTVSALGQASLWYIKKPGIPGVKVNRETQQLMHLSKEDVQPVITPQNIHHKISTYLLFL